jgi:hypothetical protein
MPVIGQEKCREGTSSRGLGTANQIKEYVVQQHATDIYGEMLFKSPV